MPLSVLEDARTVARMDQIARSFVPAFLLAAASLSLASCHATGSSAVVGSVTASDPGSPPNLIVRYDGDTLLIVARGAVSAEVFQKATASLPNGMPLFGPIGTTGGGTLIHSRTRDVKLELDVGEPLPAWLLTTGLVRPAEVASLGLAFEPQ